MSDSSSFLSRFDLHAYLLASIGKSRCVNLVGVSNIGKSTALRAFRQPAVQQAACPDSCEKFHIFYIDCNRMLVESEQAFYELIMRVLLQDLQQEDPTLRASIQQDYEQLIHPDSSLHIPLSFNQAITTLVESQADQVVLVFDEFDSAFRALDGRVFLNLRALKDRYGKGLSYIASTHRRLIHLRMGEDVDDFIELFRTNVRFVPPLNETDARALIQTCAGDVNARFDETDIDFLLAQAGGHPALTELACRKLAQVTGEVQRTSSQNRIIHRQVRDMMRRSPDVIAECQRIWRDLTDMEQAALESGALYDQNQAAEAVDELVRKGIVQVDGSEIRLFSALFENFLQRQRANLSQAAAGVHVDSESGQVTVDGRPIPNLTRLEFRMMLLLYGQLNKICDKYSIVESVWGEDYVDEVYDAAIEKLVSRLRKKIEPDPSHPRHLLTVRGRGYKLVG